MIQLLNGGMIFKEKIKYQSKFSLPLASLFLLGYNRGKNKDQK